LPVFLNAQITGEIVLKQDTEIVWENQQLHKFFESQLNIIEKIDGKTWVCIPEKTHFKKGEKVMIIEGVPIAYKDTGNNITICDTKSDMVQYDFKTGKKTKLNAGHANMFRYPKDVKNKIKDKTKKVKL